jgi:rubrerythrin
MMSATQAELDSLNTAIKTEQDGRAFYQEAAQRAANPLAKSVFEHLADEELVHIEVIQKFYDELKSKGSCQEAEAALQAPETPQTRTKNVFEKACQNMDQQVPADTASLEAYEKAMDFEQKAYDTYKQLAESSRDCMALKLYQFMMEQENQHYVFLKETHDYLEKPGDWFAQQEKPHFEG